MAATAKPLRAKHKEAASKMVKEHKRDLTEHGKMNSSAHHAKKHAKKIVKKDIRY